MLCQIIRRTGDPKLYKEISNNNDCIQLQNDLYALNAWTYDRLLKFNPVKCSVVYLKLTLR